MSLENVKNIMPIATNNSFSAAHMEEYVHDLKKRMTITNIDKTMVSLMLNLDINFLDMYYFINRHQLNISQILSTCWVLNIPKKKKMHETGKKHHSFKFADVYMLGHWCAVATHPQLYYIYIYINIPNVFTSLSEHFLWKKMVMRY